MEPSVTTRRGDPQIQIRMPASVKELVRAAAKSSGRSQNAEIIWRLSQTLRKEDGPAEGATSPSHGPASPSHEISMNNHDGTTTAGISTSHADRSDEEPIVLIGRQIGFWNGVRDTASESQFSRQGDLRDPFLDRTIDHAEDLILALRGNLTALRASSLEGAAIQIAEALNRVDGLLDHIDGALSHSVRSEARALVRLLYSALKVVDETAPRRLAETVHRNFEDRQCDPWDISARLSEEEGAR